MDPTVPEQRHGLKSPSQGWSKQLEVLQKLKCVFQPWSLSFSVVDADFAADGDDRRFTLGARRHCGLVRRRIHQTCRAAHPTHDLLQPTNNNILFFILLSAINKKLLESIWMLKNPHGAISARSEYPTDRT